MHLFEDAIDVDRIRLLARFVSLLLAVLLLCRRARRVQRLFRAFDCLRFRRHVACSVAVSNTKIH